MPISLVLPQPLSSICIPPTINFVTILQNDSSPSNDKRAYYSIALLESGLRWQHSHSQPTLCRRPPSNCASKLTRIPKSQYGSIPLSLPSAGQKSRTERSLLIINLLHTTSFVPAGHVLIPCVRHTRWRQSIPSIIRKTWTKPPRKPIS